MIKKIRQELKQSRDLPYRGVNLMGCNENWYDVRYAIAKTFSDEELNQLTPHEVYLLCRLASTLGEAFY